MSGRPGAFETFAWQFLRRVNAEFAAAGDFAGGVVQHVGRAFGEHLVGSLLPLILIPDSVVRFAARQDQIEPSVGIKVNGFQIVRLLPVRGIDVVRGE